MGGVIDGQAVDAATTNPAFLDANGDDVANGIIGFVNTNPLSGPSIGNTQGLQNQLKDTTGATETTPGTTYSSNNVITNGDNHQVALGKVDAKFNAATGHAHDGTAGNGAPISGASLANIPLKGSFIQGTDLSVTGVSTDVSGFLIGAVPSSLSTVKGIVVVAPQNRIIIRQASGTNVDDQYLDAFGNQVFGRLTELAGVWTLSYYSNIAGVETAFAFPAASPVRWYYQQLYSPVVDAPVYSELAIVPSDNTVVDVPDATATQRGVVTSPATPAQSVGAANAAGVLVAQMARLDHAHQGVHSLAKDVGDTTQVFGDVQLQEGANVTITRVGNIFNITANPGAASQDETVASLNFAASPKTVLLTDHVFFVDCTAGPVVVNLYQIAGNLGKRVRVKKTDATANTVTINAFAGDTIDGQAALVLANQYQAVSMLSFTNIWGIFA